MFTKLHTLAGLAVVTLYTAPLTATRQHPHSIPTSTIRGQPGHRLPLPLLPPPALLLRRSGWTACLCRHRRPRYSKTTTVHWCKAMEKGVQHQGQIHKWSLTSVRCLFSYLFIHNYKKIEYLRLGNGIRVEDPL